MKKEDINENEDSEDGMEDLEIGEEAADFVAGEEDYDDDGFHIKNVKSMIWNSLRNTKRSILIETRYYQVKRNKPLRRDASEVLFKLCQHAKVSVIDVIDVLELGADVNYQGKKGFAALHWVAKRGHSHVLWALLQPQVGANINIVDNRNATPLMYACDSMSSEQAVIVREILNTDKAKVNIRDSGGNTALLNAIYKNNVWVVRELLLYPRKISVLLKQEKEDPSPYELGQFIFTNGLLSEVEDIHPFVLEPALGSIHEGTWRRRWNTLLYRLFSPKGHYKYAWLVKIQEYNSYDAEIVFRMIQRRSYEEGRKPAMVLPHKKGPPPGTFKSEEELLNDRHKKFVEKYYKPVVMKRKKKSEYESMKEHKERSL